jgi:hypothetical protein
VHGARHIGANQHDYTRDFKKEHNQSAATTMPVTPGAVAIARTRIFFFSLQQLHLPLHPHTLLSLLSTDFLPEEVLYSPAA